MRNLHSKSTGGQTIFTAQEEKLFVNHIIALSTFGFPMTAFDLRMSVKSYLDKCGRTVLKFKGNTPGPDWVDAFINRHKSDLSKRFARNITHSRASVDENMINNFFNHLEKELDGVPTCNIWNFDETNLVDDPGSKKVLVKRGTKYPEKIRNATKACTSIMVCGNAEGVLAPIYVNYKSENLWQTWTEGGPPQTRYNRTKSGWFDSQSFEDWFGSLMLPILKKQTGKKILLGDNLSSHLNIEVVRLCNENNIAFVALPPNATHLLQPLDVAYFRPMKGEWRKILNDWKETSYGSRCTSIPKDQFPQLLKKLVDSLNERGRQNLKSGFMKCGIAPLQREKVLERLCDSVMKNIIDYNNIATSQGSMTTGSVDSQNISDSFLEELKKKRNDEVTSRGKKRRRKMQVVPGKSVSAEELLVNVDNCNPSTSSRKNKKGKKTSDSSEIEDKEVIFDEGDDSLGGLIDSDSAESDLTNTEQASRCTLETNINVGDFIAFLYEGKVYPGQITAIDESDMQINSMVKSGKYWKWPTRKDEIWYSKDAVLRKLSNPVKFSRRELFIVDLKP